MAYKNILDPIKCNGCYNRDFCFLRKISLQDYPESTQNFIVHIPSSLFSVNKTEYRWHTNYQAILNHIIACYDAQHNIIQENLKHVLSIEAQRDSDRQFIRDKFRQLLDVAAKATEKSAPEISKMHRYSQYKRVDCGYFSANPNN